MVCRKEYFLRKYPAGTPAFVCVRCRQQDCGDYLALRYECEMYGFIPEPNRKAGVFCEHLMSDEISCEECPLFVLVKVRTD